MTEEILVIEDDDNIRRMLELSLKTAGYCVVTAGTGTVGLALARSGNPAVVLLDLGLPDCDGVSLIPSLADAADAPIIVVTARDQESQKVTALDAGADDYVVKPFGMSELLARIRVATRRNARKSAACDLSCDFAGLHIDRGRRVVELDGKELHLTPNEYALLAVFADNCGKALTHRSIQHEVWGYPTTDDFKTLRVLVASLRRKLKDHPSNPRFIRTEIGVGYRFIGESKRG